MGFKVSLQWFEVHSKWVTVVRSVFEVEVVSRGFTAGVRRSKCSQWFEVVRSVFEVEVVSRGVHGGFAVSKVFTVVRSGSWRVRSGSKLVCGSLQWPVVGSKWK